MRVDLRVLVLSGGDVGTSMMVNGLREAGVPFTEVDLTQESRAEITREFLSDESSSVRRAKFQAVVAPNAAPAELTPEEVAALRDFQHEFGIRRVDSYVYPSAAVGLESAAYSGSLDGLRARVTAQGRATFGYLAGDVEVDDFDPSVTEAYGYLARPADSEDGFESLVEVEIPGGRDGFGSLVGVFHDDARDELVITLAMSVVQLHQQALFPGILSWMTRGVHLGTERHYLTVHVDDMLLSDARWIPEHHCTRGNDCPADVTAPDIRMTVEDVDAMTEWQERHLFQLLLAFNGGAYDVRVEDFGVDLVGDAIIAAPGARFVSHTYSHEYLGCVRDLMQAGFPCRRAASGEPEWVSFDVVRAEVVGNQRFARAHGLGARDDEIVTGEHSGLRRLPDEAMDNPSFVQVLGDAGIAWVASDASRERDSRAIGSARTVPRYPMNVYFNVATRAEVVDEFNWIHTDAAHGGGGRCGKVTGDDCLAPLEPSEGFEAWIVPRDARAMLLHALSNDPRPHYAHQSNLAEDRLLYPVLERALSEYRGMFGEDAPLVQLGLGEAGEVLRDQAAWLEDMEEVNAYVEAGELNVSVSRSARVPLTLPTASRGRDGAAVLPSYAGAQTGWQSVEPEARFVVSLPEDVGYAR